MEVIMKNYTITVNGNVYDVAVEEKGSTVSSAAPVSAAPAAAPAASGSAGSVKIEAKAAGKVFAIDTKVGDTVKKGDTVLVLEVMKMETPVVAEADGTIASINVAKGDKVEVGQLLATLN